MQSFLSGKESIIRQTMQSEHRQRTEKEESFSYIHPPPTSQEKKEGSTPPNANVRPTPCIGM